MNYIKTILIGRLTDDPELKYTKSGTGMCNFSIASNYYKGKDQEKGVSYFSCIAWAKQGEAIAQHFKKGDPIFIDAEPRQERWEKDGNKKSKIVFHIREFQFLKSKSNTTEQNNSAPVENSPFNDNDIPV